VPAGVLKSWDHGFEAGFNWTRADQLYTIYMDFDSATVLDGVPYVAYGYVSDPVMPVEVTDLWVHSFITGTRICKDAIFWNHSSVDPFLGIIFHGDTDVEDSRVPNKKNSLPTGTKIAIGVSLGLIGLGMATIALLVIFVPSVKYFFLPHSQRGDAFSTHELRNSGQPLASSWKASPAPSTISNI
jgi:hypothetical protein